MCPYSDLTSLYLSPVEVSEYDTVKNSSDAHFIARRNVILERAKFNQRQQEPGESAHSFITALHCLAEQCGHGAPRHEMVRDRLVVGLRDTKLPEQLQIDPELKLEKAVARARQSEQIKKTQECSRETLKDITNTQLDSVHVQQRHSRPSQLREEPRKTFKQTQGKRCGDMKDHSLQLTTGSDHSCLQ